MKVRLLPAGQSINQRRLIMDEYTNEKALIIIKLLGLTQVSQSMLEELENLVDEIYQEGFEDAEEEDEGCYDFADMEDFADR
jgi:hypothetical protein